MKKKKGRTKKVVIYTLEKVNPKQINENYYLVNKVLVSICGCDLVIYCY